MTQKRKKVREMNSKKMVAMVAVLMMAFVGMFASTVSAGVYGQDNSLNNSINLPGFSFWYNTSTAGGKSNFCTGMTNVDQIAGASVTINKDDQGSFGQVNANFWGIVGHAADQPWEWGSYNETQSMNVNRRGAQYSSTVGLSYYQETIGWVGDKDGYPILGDWMSGAWVDVTLFDVVPTSANANYSEYTDDAGVTSFYANVNWEVIFVTSTTPGFSQSMAVPEPATMSLLGLGLFGLITRRKRRQ